MQRGNAQGMNILGAEAEHGWANLEPAYRYSGIKGETRRSCRSFTGPWRPAGAWKFREMAEACGLVAYIEVSY